MTNHKNKILIVEDMKVQQKIAAMTFNTLNCDVDTAETGAQALELVCKTNYDFIFMDLGLDDMDGFTVTQTIRKTSKHVPIIALTAHSEENLKSKCFEAGMTDFIQKPITNDIAKNILNKYKK